MILKNNINFSQRDKFIAVDKPKPKYIPFSCVGVINQVQRFSIKQSGYKFSVGTLVSDNLMLTSTIAATLQNYFYPGMSETIYPKGFIQMKIIKKTVDQQNYCLLSLNIDSNRNIPYLNIHYSNNNQNILYYTNVLQVCYKVKKATYYPIKSYPIKDQYMRVLNLTYFKNENVLIQTTPSSLNFKKLIKQELYELQGSPLLIEQNGQYKLLGITTVLSHYKPKYIHCSQFFDGVKPYKNSICHLSDLNLWHKKICKVDLKYFIQRMNFRKLIRLDLGWNYLHDQSIIALFKFKYKFRNLESLNLNTNLITEGIKCFSSQNFPQLIKLSIANNSIQNEGFITLYNQIKESKIKILDLRNNNLTKKQIKVFIQKVKGTNKIIKTQQLSQKKESFTSLELIILENKFFSDNKQKDQKQIFYEQIKNQEGVVIERKESRTYIYIYSNIFIPPPPPQNKQ